MKVTIKELTIESDSDFSHVNIDFSNGSMVYTTDTKKEKKPERVIETPNYKDTALDLDSDFSHSSEDIVEKPVIEDQEREVKISTDMMDATY